MISLLAFIALAGSPTKTEITVYNQGFALVKEHRTLPLKLGRQTVSIEDVASQIDPTSVSILSVTDTGSFRILEQNYQYDLISPEAILSKSVGGRVRFIRTVANQRDVLEGTLISSPTSIVNSPQGGQEQTYNGMVIRADDGRIVLNPTGEVEVTSVPKGLISKPTLLWDLESDKAGDNEAELSYITQGMKWSSDYVLTLNGTGKAGLQGWVTVDNQSGTTYENALLKLLAGDVNTAKEPMAIDSMRNIAAKAEFAGGGFKEEGLFEYHLYTLQRPTTVRNKETKQISLLEAPSIMVNKRMIVDAAMNFGRYFPAEGEIGTGDIKPQVRIDFTNSKENNLGIPLPKGKFRIYQRDQSGSVQLLGEDQIEHTPKNEKLSLVVGRAFDVVANRRRTNFTRINSNEVRESYEIELRNRKDTDEEIEVIERHYGDWRVLDKNTDYVKTSADSMVFKVNVKAGEVKKIDYTVDTKW